ncbi:MAG: hypothetical protein CM15mP78_12200 [Candidatus Poseidoniales archaeon]|nr:MAG: hypothetical protein CM15mP78_12200 [Candidatus Poseidoniales archaeon]
MAHIAIIGSGIAGLFAASQLADAGHRVTVVTKKRPKDSSTNWAQGGVAAILDKTNHEGMESHVQDTLRSGDGACDEAVVRSIINEAGERIRDLIRIGVEFEKEDDGNYSLIREGGHSSKRILHAKDATGKEIERALTAYARQHPGIALKPNTLAIDLIQRRHGHPEHGVAGVWCLDQDTQAVITVQADAIVLATGGVGRLGSKPPTRTSPRVTGWPWPIERVHPLKTWPTFNSIQPPWHPFHLVRFSSQKPCGGSGQFCSMTKGLLLGKRLAELPRKKVRSNLRRHRFPSRFNTPPTAHWPRGTSLREPLTSK